MRTPPTASTLRLVKGSHIVVPRLFEHDHAYIFQNADGRIIFAIPYEGDFTLIGTTDVEHHGAIGEAHADAEEIAYLCAQASRYFAKPVTPAQVVWTYSGVRPLLDDESGNPAAVTRDYRLELDTDGGAPLLSVWGGKITTFRKLAEEAADLLAPTLTDVSMRGAWTAGAPLARRRPARRSSAPTRHRRPRSMRPSRASSLRWRGAIPPSRRRCCAAWRGTTARGPRAFSTAGSAPRSRPASSRRARALCAPTSGRGAATTCSGAAPSSGCTSTPTGAPPWRRGWPSAKTWLPPARAPCRPERSEGLGAGRAAACSPATAND